MRLRLLPALTVAWLLAATVASGQEIRPPGTISTAGSDCSVASNCYGFAVDGYVSWTVYIDVPASGTFVYEASQNATNNNDGLWYAVTDDINGASSSTSDGPRSFSNPGYRRFRIRASAINGIGVVTSTRGYAGLRSTASLTGSSGDGAILDGSNPAIKATVFDLTNANPIAVRAVDGNGDPASFGGGAAQNDNTGLAQITGGGFLFDATPPTITDGNIGAPRMDANRYAYAVFPTSQQVNLSAALPAGTNNIGDVDVLSVPADPFGTNADAASATGSISAKLRAIAATGIPVTSLPTLANVTTVATVTSLSQFGGQAITLGAGAVAGGTLRITQASDSPSVVALQLIDNPIGSATGGSAGTSSFLAGGVFNSTPPTLTNGQQASAQLDASGNLKVNIAAGGTTDATSGQTASTTGPQGMLLAKNTAPSAVTDGQAVRALADLLGTAYFRPSRLTPWRSIDLDESEEEASATATEVCTAWVTNTATSTRWLKFYNATAASTTVGTTTPVATIAIPGNADDDVSGGLPLDNGCLAFDTALSVAATTGQADNDTGAPGAGEVTIVLGLRSR